MLEKEFEANLKFVTANEKKFLKYYKDKFILVCKQEVIGSYDSFDKAAAEGVYLYGLDAGFVVCHIASKEPLDVVLEGAL